MLNDMYDIFDLIVKKTNAFLNYINQIETIRNKDIVIEHELPQQRFRKRKRMVDETTEDSFITDPMKKFKVEVFKSVISQAIQSISQRFEANKQIYENFSGLITRNFKSLDLLSDSKFTDIAKKIGIDNVELKNELLSFTQIYRLVFFIFMFFKNGSFILFLILYVYLLILIIYVC
ncbi:unnamed protein product [Psylliodes chrysocephalus]|uniref:Uncharacterized protein n=1 Tax=Psylliodes chrysocephalus TaxID=3402493 RepID=A0A9P0G901_9CUCU|nr:unnamed protein product [Psylliodes chrysocephala]